MLYERARNSYTQCISSEENAFLQDEAQVPLEAIALRDMTVRIVFPQYDASAYTVEAELGLYTNGHYMGRYTYSETHAGEPIEDSLVFY